MQKPVRMGLGFARASFRLSPLRRNGAMTAANLRKHANRSGQADEKADLAVRVGVLPYGSGVRPSAPSRTGANARRPLPV